MKLLSTIYLSLIGLIIGITGCQKTAPTATSCEAPYQYGLIKNKQCGMSFAAPKDPLTVDPMIPLDSLGVNAIACIPYSFFYKNKPTIQTFSSGGWWGETVTGICASIQYAHSHNIQVMLKPQLWNWEQWIGELDMSTEAEWDTFEQEYTDFIMKWVNVADSMDVEMFCIGTEIRNAVKKRPNYWRNLIDEIRLVYKGKLTYAPNWNDYQEVTFWDQLDYIGIDAYFPLLEDKTPSVCDLKEAWQPVVAEIHSFQQQYNKPVIFTEYGYLSLDGCAYQTWVLEQNRNSVDINEQAQANAVQALLEVFGEKDWWQGGYQWKWYPDAGASAGEGPRERDYTPQEKQCEIVLKAMYK